MTPFEIAKKLKRRVEPIQEYLITIAQGLNEVKQHEQHAEFNLVKRHFWKDITTQFDHNEQDAFVHLWGKIIGQFRKSSNRGNDHH